MPTVVGFEEQLKKRCTCGKCTAIVEYIPREVESASSMDYGGFTDTYWFIHCPNCGNKLQVSRPK